jgi:flagellar hook protein FlgE
MPSFSVSLSGLLANQEALAVIANNLSNLNTTGYKDVRAEFSDLISQQLGSAGDGDPIQVGLGTQIGSTSTQFTQGNIESTGVSTDLAIQGDGFLQTQKGGLTLFTRDGNLTLDPQGFLVTQDGAQVMGYPAVNGVVGSSGALAPIRIQLGSPNPPRSTGNVQVNMNLDASAAIGATFSTSMGIFDSLGVTHIISLNFTKTAANNWSYQITVPAADVGQSGPPVVISSGTLTFNGAGQLTSPPGNVTGITIPNLADGASNLVFNWNLYDSSNTPVVTQVAGTSAASQTFQDGFAGGSLQSFTISSDGTILGAFSNGQSAPIGRIALATFPNSQGLLSTGQNSFMTTIASGLPTVGVPGTGGRGTIVEGGLESSNVDIATEFAQLILAQRGYEANARAFTTTDQIVNDSLNLKAT